ncbi:c-type cytochrome domain-containing protein [Nannocystis pusilla]|uniref:Cytochrome C Planctomycete-type domain-containing protein n=1 Tax=Nannocystis pusilla TaxID=889268 RepID=A0ABS7TL23_9BACT|nr:c-type cytochrome domain-containing protein [Nannocystis pusilla]MBZ5708923.1 hypothetical protein [Nannocystis pusilla]
MSQRSSYSTTPLVTAAALALLAGGACKTVVLPSESGGGEDTESTDGNSGPSTDGGGGSEGGGSSTGEPADGIVPAHCSESSPATLKILTDNCAKCHGGSAPQPAGSINYITNLDALIKEGKVVPGRPEDSRVFLRMIDENSPMPPAAETQRPTDTDIAVVERWISECAGKSSCSDQPFITREEMLTLILSDIGNNVPLEQQKFTRYFSFVHLYNTGWCSDQIEVYRQALAKLVNSLSDEPGIRAPIPIDPENRLIYRIDIRDYGWDAALWDTIADFDPYAIDYLQDTADKIKKDVQSKIFVLAGDAFLASASQPPLYHTILDIPETRAQLEAKFNINVQANIDEEILNNPNKVARAGFHNSDVSFNHRMIERHEFKDASNRIYWVSYDFAGNDGVKNFFDDPFGFEEDGGEIIFTLPNGLQGYMLVDAFGNRIDEGPSAVVQDKNMPDGIVVNGVSCMGCHFQGMITVDDDLRFEIDNGGGIGIFDAQEIEAIKNLFPTRTDFRKLLVDDSTRFTAAVNSAGVPSDGDIEPVLTVFLAFDEDVTLRRAAAELGLTASDFSTLIGSLSTNDLNDLRKPDTSIQRDVFTSNFAQTVCDLKLGLTNKCPTGFEN